VVKRPVHQSAARQSTEFSVELGRVFTITNLCLDSNCTFIMRHAQCIAVRITCDICSFTRAPGATSSRRSNLSNADATFLSTAPSPPLNAYPIRKIPQSFCANRLLILSPPLSTIFQHRATGTRYCHQFGRIPLIGIQVAGNFKFRDSHEINVAEMYLLNLSFPNTSKLCGSTVPQRATKDSSALRRYLTWTAH